MKISMTASALLAVTLLSASVTAQEPGERPRQRPRAPGAERQREGGADMARMMAQRIPLMRALDVDQDGTLSAAEIENASKALMKLDRDGDGTLTTAELRPDFAAMAREGRPGEGRPRNGQPGPDGGPAASREMMARMFEQRDANGDGVLSGNEIPERMKQNLARVDENGDGSLSKSELEAAMRAMAERVGQTGQRGAQRGADGSGVRPKRPAQKE